MRQQDNDATRSDAPVAPRGLAAWWPYLGDGAIILALSLWVGHPYLRAGNAFISNYFADGFGDPYLNIGIALTNLDLLRQRVIPLGTAWFPSTWAGLPGAIGVFGLPSLALWLVMGLTPLAGVYAAYNLVVFLIIVLAAASAYYLGHVVTGKRTAAIVAASAYAFAPHTAGVLLEGLAQVDIMMSLGLLPLMLAFWEKLLRQPTRRHTILASLGTVLVFLSYPQTGLYGAIYVAFRLALQSILQIRAGLPPLARLVAASGVAGALALAVLLPVYIPALLFRPITRDYWEAEVIWAQGYQNLSMLGEVLVLAGVLALGIVAWRYWRRRRLEPTETTVASTVLIFAYFYLLALGSESPLPVLRFSFDYIPFMKTVRATGWALTPAILGLSVITGYALNLIADGIAQRFDSDKRLGWGVRLSWVAAALVIGQYWLMIQDGRAWPVYHPSGYLKKTLDTRASPIARVAADPQPARVLSLPAFGAGAVMGAVAKPDLTSEPTSDYGPNYEAFFQSKDSLVQAFMSGAPNMAEQAAVFGVKYVLLNTRIPTGWDTPTGIDSGQGSFEMDFEDKKEGWASLRARWHAEALGRAFVGYYLTEDTRDWSRAERLSLWVKFSQGDWKEYSVGVQDASGAIAWRSFAYQRAEQWQEISVALPLAGAPSRFQWNKVIAVVIGASDPAKALADLDIRVNGIRLVKEGREIPVDASTEAMFTLADYLKSKPQDFRFLAFEEGWFLFENLRFRGMAFELCPSEQPCDPVAIDYQRPDANTIRLSFDLDKPPARLLVSETYHQGWVTNDPRVKVGLEPQARLLTLDVDQPGHYDVTLRYQPYDQFLLWVALGWGSYLVAVIALGLPWGRLFRSASQGNPS